MDTVDEVEVDSSKVVRLNSKLLSFNIRVVKSISNSFRVEGYKLLGMLVTNLLSCVRKKQYLTYSRHKNNDSFLRDDGTKVSTRDVIKNIDWLVENGYAISLIGKPSKHVELREPSVLIPTDKFFEKYINKELLKEAEVSYSKSVQVLLLRSKREKGIMKEIKIRMTEEMKRMEMSVRLYNDMLELVDIRDEDNNLLTNYYMRIWSWASLKLSGRWYGHVVNMPRVDRLGLTMDGMAYQ